MSDIKDFEPPGVPALGSGQSWACLGKHLCGAATDFAMLCMARCAAEPAAALACQAAYQNGSLDSPPSNSHAQGGRSQQASDSKQAEPEASGGAGAARLGLQGFGIATCCHHRCSWDHYVGRGLFTEHGVSEAEFQLVAWMTGAPYTGILS